MTHRALVLVLVASLSLALFGAVASAQTFGAVLTGSQEVPATTSPGTGFFTMTFDATSTNATVTISVANLGSAITGYHIHQAAAGANGSIVFNIQGLGGTFTNGKLFGIFPMDPAIAKSITQNPAGFYANVHTSQFPGGAIRGQLSLVSGSVVNYAAELRGTNEVPPNSSTAYGSAFVTFDTTNQTLAWEVNTTGIVSPTLSHIHGPGGPIGTNAPVLINFATSPSAFTGGRTKGIVDVSTLSAANLDGLLNNASSFYVNVHSAAVPGGEIRGQLVPANEYDVPVAGHVTNGSGQTFVTDARVFNPSYDTATAALIEYFQAGTSANTNATASMAVTLPPRGTAILDDVVGAAGLNVSGSTGALRVSSASTLAVTSRIYDDLRSIGKGTFGQYSPGTPRANALRRGVLPHLSNQSDLSSGFRTNLGFFNPGTTVATVRLELRNPTGTLMGTSVITLQPLSQQQSNIATYFSVDLSAQPNLTLSFDASSPIIAGAAVNDNISGDSIFVQAQVDTGVAAN